MKIKKKDKSESKSKEIKQIEIIQPEQIQMGSLDIISKSEGQIWLKDTKAGNLEVHPYLHKFVAQPSLAYFVQNTSNYLWSV